MTTRHLLTEHKAKSVELPDSIVEELHRSFAKQLQVRYGGSAGNWELVPSSYVGMIRVDDHEFLIQPKVPLENLLALMDVEVVSETWGREIVGLASDPNLLAVMARLFCVACEDTTRRGVRRSYVRQEEALVSPRGRIDIGRLATSPGTLTPVPCIFDEHTTNHRLNQILRAAAKRARRVPALGAAWQRRLLTQLAQFEDVDDVASHDWSWVDRWEPSPMEQHYATAVRLAHMILTGSSVRSGFGESQAHTFLLDMNYLFEAWVGRRLAEYCTQHQIAEQDSLELDIEGDVKMRPDIVARIPEGRVVAVADCKYKRLEKGDGRNPDYYQALAYATAHRLPEAWLIYAREPGQIESKDVTVRHAGIRLRTFGLDLSGPVSGAIDQLQVFANRAGLGH